MSDEPRRSGRATKGFNPKHQHEEAITSSGKRSKSKAKSGKEARIESPTEEEGEDTIRCICGIQDDEGGRAYICCDNCDAWQHNDCMGLTDIPEHYYCEQCAPEKHKELLDAIKRGEKPVDIAARRREEAKSKKKGKAGRKSKSGRQSKGVDAQEEEQETVQEDSKPEMEPAIKISTAELSKRKFQAEEEDLTEQPTKLRKGSGPLPAERPNVPDRRKSGGNKKQIRKSTASAVEPLSIVHSIGELPNENRMKIAEALSRKIEQQLKDIITKGTYIVPQGQTQKSLSENLALSIEQSLYSTYCQEADDYTGGYKNQFTIIVANLPRNSSLLHRLLEHQLNTDELARMTDDDMANEELQQRIASMKEEADKQAMMIQDNSEGPRVRRTHKGEELVDDQANQIASESIMAAPPPRRRESEMLELQSGADMTSAGDAQKTSTAESMTAPTSRLAIDTVGLNARSMTERRSSSNFDIQNVWSSVHSPDQDQSRVSLPPGVGSVKALPPSSRVEHADADIDRLLDEDGGESPPYSPAEYGDDSALTWKGTIDMPMAAGDSVAKFKAIAHHVAGTDLAGRSVFSAIFPPDLVLHGRIEDKRADKYLTSLSSARSTDVTVHSVVPASVNDSRAQAQFDKLFNYFSSRQRYGVVGDKLHRPNVRDIYVIPLEAGMGSLPTFLDRLDFNIIEQPRPHRLLLVVFVLKWEDGRASAQATPSQLENTVTMKSPFQEISQGGVQSQTPLQSSDMVMSPITGMTGLNHTSPSILQSAQMPHTNLPPTGQFPNNPYTPVVTQSHPNQSNIAANNVELAKQILGEFYTCPTAQTILTGHQQDIPADLLRNLRRVLEAYPPTRNDMSSFQDQLSRQQNSVQAIP